MKSRHDDASKGWQNLFLNFKVKEIKKSFKNVLKSPIKIYVHKFFRVSSNTQLF